jgi:aspartate dehydrogenase
VHGYRELTLEEALAECDVVVECAGTTGMWEQLTERMIADPHAPLTNHEIAAAGGAGDDSFSVCNLPHEKNPATSNVVPAAILFGPQKLANPSGRFL